MTEKAGGCTCTGTMRLGVCPACTRDNEAHAAMAAKLMQLQGYQTKDSGERQEFETGSRRDTRKGKGRYDLISPIAVQRIAGVMERGSSKYGERNWEKGQPVSRYLDSAIRHIFQHMEGQKDEDHLAQAAWNLMSAIHTEEMVSRGSLPAELADLPDYTRGT